MEHKHHSQFLLPFLPFFISLPLSIGFFFPGGSGNQTLGPMKAKVEPSPHSRLVPSSLLPFSAFVTGMGLFARLHVVPTNKVEGFLDIEPHGHLLTAEILN